MTVDGDGERAESREEMGGVALAAGVVVAESALRFSFSRGGGPGGQNVNRRSTQAELRVSIDGIPIDDGAKRRLARLAGARLTGEGEIVIVSHEHRTQRRNREECLSRLREMVGRAVVKPRKRKPTKPTRASVQRRLEQKQRRSDVKRRRKPPEV